MESQIINHSNHGTFKIYTSNDILKFRAKTFATKEPTTLEWIQSLEPDSVLIDVGANIGIYTIPSALFHVKKVIALEPEIKNFNMLLNNLELNGINADKVEALQLGISTEFQNKSTKIFITQDIAGSSCHQVGRNQNHLLQGISKGRKSKTIYCISLSSIVRNSALTHSGPIHIKIDVDGIEEDVCQSLFDDKCISRVSSLQIELNPYIKSHSTLIKRLADSGLYYSHEQVSRSIRRSGDFKGFAEIVFKRNISQEMLKILPTSYYKFLGNNYQPIKKNKSSELHQDFMSLCTTKIIPNTILPSSFILKNAFNASNCSDLFHDVAKEVLSKEFHAFQFKSETSGSGKPERINRCAISHETINNINSSYAEQLYAQASSKEFISRIFYMYRKALKSIYDNEELLKVFPPKTPRQLNGYQLVCRIRHFLDIYGYSLDRHNDSQDTICAFIAPIFPFSTPTSMIYGRYYDRNIMDSGIKKGDLKPSEFAPNSFYYASKSTNSLHDFVKVKDKILYRASFKFSPTLINPGEAIVIPNLTSISIDPKSSYANNINKHICVQYGHGVLPFVEEPYRPVLLIDFLFTKTQSLKSDEACKSSPFQQIIDLGKASSFYNYMN